MAMIQGQTDQCNRIKISEIEPTSAATFDVSPKQSSEERRLISIEWRNNHIKKQNL